jgi:signal transduction histidine kinase
MYGRALAVLARFDELSRSRAAAPALRTVIDELERDLYALSELNRQYLHASADRVLRRGRRFAVYCVFLDGLAVLVALGTMWLVTRTLRDYLARLERRSSELEHLAVQIGHEIGNPLTPVTLALESCASSDAAAATRGKKAIARIRASVDRLIGFASAGDARRVPAEGTAVAGVLDACGVHLDAGVDARVAFEPDALRDVVSDLVKVSSEPPLALDHVEVQLRPSHVRVIAVCSVKNGNERPADPFEPQMHGVDSGHPGIDLRLATARRCVEARGGAVGVRDRGSERRLWIDLART